jgi:hypothetical protein
MSKKQSKIAKKYTKEELDQIEKEVLKDFDDGMLWNAIVEKHKLPRSAYNPYYLGNILNRNDRHRKVQNKVKRHIFGINIKDGTTISITFETNFIEKLTTLAKKKEISNQQLIQTILTKEIEKLAKEI